MTDLTKIWNSTEEELISRYSSIYDDLYFSDLKLVMITDKKAVFGAATEFKADIIRKKFKGAIEEYISRLLGRNITAVFYVDPDFYFEPEHYIDEQTDKSQVIIDERYLRPMNLSGSGEGEGFSAPVSESMLEEEAKYTFDNFIEGSSNKFAKAAAEAVADSPAHEYNPLFIYGDSGLGKTHLLYAITGRIRKNFPDYKIVYVKSEDFTNEIVAGIRSGSMENLREKYRNCDVLLIDDVQFIANKKSTQEEYLNTFNALFEAGKQIILTSDKPPKDIEDLEARLLSRFSWGLVADITPPDFDLRIAIMQQKSEQIGLTLSLDVLNYLSSNLTHNVRQLEGAVKKIAARAFLMGETNITVDTAAACISDLINSSGTGRITEDKIMDTVAKRYGVTADDIKGKIKTKEVAEARKISIYLMKKLMNMTYVAISKIIPRNHTSIMHAYNSVESEMKDNALYERNINSIITEIKETD